MKVKCFILIFIVFCLSISFANAPSSNNNKFVGLIKYYNALFPESSYLISKYTKFIKEANIIIISLGNTTCHFDYRDSFIAKEDKILVLITRTTYYNAIWNWPKGDSRLGLFNDKRNIAYDRVNIQEKWYTKINQLKYKYINNIPYVLLSLKWQEKTATPRKAGIDTYIYKIINNKFELFLSTPTDIDLENVIISK
jgi:hypothetical protein